VLHSVPPPPAGFAPGPGSNFNSVATYTFPRPNSGFDPVAAYDPSTGLLHIIGTQNNAINSRYSDLIKFTFDTNTQTLSGPHILTTASAVRDGYDMVVLANGHRLVAVSLLDATMVGAEALFQAPITNVAIATTGTPAETTLTITAINTFSEGQLATLTGLTNATFLNGATVQVISASPTQFTAAYTTDYPAYSAADTGLATPFYSGENLLAFELWDTPLPDSYLSGSLYIVASSPDRSGNTFSAVSLVTPDGLDIELYYGD